MIFNAAIALTVVLIAVLWSTKAKGYGMFSAFMALVCTLAAGAIAFAFWEPLAYMLLGFAGAGTGFFPRLLMGGAWGLGLLLPFTVSLLVLRIVVDTFVKANLDFSETANMAGGFIFGAGSGVITAGIVAIGVGHLNHTPSLMGFAPVEEKGGSPVYASGLWIPVDAWTARLYEGLSVHSFASPTPLAQRHPNAHQAAAMQRITYREASRNTLRPDDAEIIGRYTITGPIDALLTDTFLVDPAGNTKKQTVLYPDDSSPRQGDTLEGFAVRFRSGAKEKGGNVVVTPGQVRLIAVNSDGDATAVHPIAVIAPPDAASGGLYRFRFDVKESFIASAGGGSEAVFAFEFIVPQGYNPTDILIKNARFPVGPEKGVKTVTYANPAARDEAVRKGGILSSFGVAVAGAPIEVDRSISRPAQRQGNRFADVEVGSILPDGMTLNRQNRGTLEINSDNLIVQGQHTFESEVFFERFLDRNLRVERLATGRDTGIVYVRLASKGASSMFGRAVETAESILQPRLIDDRGNAYEPVGYIYNDGSRIQFRYTPGSPLRALSEAPALSRTKRDQTMYLIFRPTTGVKIMSFVLGSREIATFPEGIEVRN